MAIAGRKINIEALFEGLTHRKKLLSQYSVSIYNSPQQIRATAKNLNIIKMIILGRQMNSRVYFWGWLTEKSFFRITPVLCVDQELCPKNT